MVTPAGGVRSPTVTGSPHGWGMGYGMYSMGMGGMGMMGHPYMGMGYGGMMGRTGMYNAGFGHMANGMGMGQPYGMYGMGMGIYGAAYIPHSYR